MTSSMGSVSVITDLREKRKLEEQLRQTEKSRLSLIESAPLVMVVADNKGRIKYVNPGFESVLGFSRSDIVTNPSIWQDLILPEDRERLGEEMTKMVQSDHFYEVEYRCTAKDGHILWLSQTTLPLRDGVGSVVGFESWAHDITKRKSAEQQVKRLAHTVESIGELVIATDLEGKITYANRAALRRLGYTLNELIGKPESVLRNSESIADLQRVEKVTKKGSQGESLFVSKSGEVFPVYLTKSPITDEGGQSVAVVGIARSISQQKRSEARRLRNQKQLTAINRAGRTVELDAEPYRCIEGCY